MEETFWSLEDDADLPPPVKAISQAERSTSAQQSPAHNGVEIIPLKHTYDDIIAFAICFVPTVWTLLIAEIWYFFLFSSLSFFIGISLVVKRQEQAFVKWHPAQRRLEFFRGKRRQGVNLTFSYTIEPGDTILGIMIEPSEDEEDKEADKSSFFSEIADYMFPFLMFNQDDIKDMAEEDDRYWFEVVRKGGEKPEYFPEPGKELRWRYQYNGLNAIMKEKLAWVESQS